MKVDFMDITTLLGNILTFSIGTISVSAVIIYISKAVFNKWLEARTLNYQNDLALKLEEFKFEKQKIAEENRIKYVKLHEDRAEVIKNLYSKLVDMEDFLSSYVNHIKQNKTSEDYFQYIRKELFQSVTDFMIYANRNKIFFDKTINHYIKEIEAITNIIVTSYEEERDDGSDLKNTETWHELTSMMINGDMKEFREELEAQFQNLLGIENGISNAKKD